MSYATKYALADVMDRVRQLEGQLDTLRERVAHLEKHKADKNTWAFERPPPGRVPC